MSAEQHYDRNLGWVLALGALLLIVRELPRLGEQPEWYSTWWLIVAAVPPAIVLCLAVGGGVLPMRMLRIAWFLIPTVGVAVTALSLPAFHGPDVNAPMSLPWGVPAFTAYFWALVLRPRLAVSLNIIAAFVPFVSRLIVFDTWPPSSWLYILNYISTTAVTLLVIGIRASLNRMHVAEARAREAEARGVEAEELARTQLALARIVHDHVLSTLTAALRVTGTTSSALRRDAARAIAVIEQAPARPQEQELLCEVAVERIASVIRMAAPDTAVVTASRPGTVPEAVIESTCGAIGEAARNSARHATAAQRNARIEVSPNSLRVRLADDGQGFDVARLPAERLGIRESIVGRMHELAGGKAIVTADPSGTTVELRWDR